MIDNSCFNDFTIQRNFLRITIKKSGVSRILGGSDGFVLRAGCILWYARNQAYHILIRPLVAIIKEAFPEGLTSQTQNKS